MSWDQRIFASPAKAEPLGELIDILVAAQRRDWLQYDQAVTALDHMAAREYQAADGTFIAKVNPRRSGSIYAKTDAAAVAQRPCFLCEENLPPLEQGIAWGELMLFPNPFPIHQRHLTIPLRAHRPQEIHGRLGAMLSLARSLGSGMLVFYNGPRCGASAPDHFHFQACARQGIPLIGQIESLQPVAGQLMPVTLTGRRFLVYAGDDDELLAKQVARGIDAMKKPDSALEPMLNLVVWRAQALTLALLLPRVAHRPAAFFAEESLRIAISPAALEMAGLLVVSDAIYLDRLNPAVIRAIYEEVCYNARDFDQLVEAVI